MLKNKISILLPTYKPGNYIVRCLQSIELQTLDKSNFKLYIALNGSDRTFETYLQEVLQEFTFQYELFFLEEASVSNARNYLIDNSSEEFVVFVDDDDLLSEDYLEELLKASSHNTIGISNVKNFTGAIDNLYENYIGNCFNKLGPVETSKFKSRKYYSSPCAKMIHRDIIGNVRFDTNLSIGEDSLFMAQLSPKVTAVQKTAGSACYYVNQREGSASRSQVNKQQEFKRLTYLLKAYSKMLINPRYDSLFIMSRIAATFSHFKRLA